MSGLAGNTTFKNTSGKTKFFPFIGPHGVTLADGATSTQPGDPYYYIRKVDARGRNALDLALQAGVLEIVASPAPVYADQATGAPQVLSVAGGVVAAVDPAWGGANPADSVVQVVSTVPANGAKSQPANATLAVTYNVAVTGTTFVVKSGGSTVTGSAAGSNGNTTWTWTPGSALTGGAVYTATVSGAVDGSGNPAPVVTTGFSVAPQVSSVTPANNATGVTAAGATVVAVFNEAVTGANVAVTLAGAAVAGSTAVSNGSKTLTWTPTGGNLQSGSKQYTVTVTGAKDAAGNVMSTFTSTFTTT